MADTTEAKKVLLEQAEALGMEVDKRWSVDTLAEKVLDAEAAKQADDKAKFDAARKVPVLLLRDSWPVAEERHFAGETIEVPIEMAKHWIASGSAQRADPLPGDDEAE